MEPSVAFKVAFYLSKIIKLGLIIGVFEACRRLFSHQRRSAVKATRLQAAKGM